MRMRAEAAAGRALSCYARRYVRVALAMAAALLTSCYAEELADLRSQVERMQACQACAHSQLTQGLALALCSPPVRQLIDDVSQVCHREDVCLDQKISTLVGDADPTHTGRFISLMRQQSASTARRISSGLCALIVFGGSSSRVSLICSMKFL